MTVSCPSIHATQAVLRSGGNPVCKTGILALILFAGLAHASHAAELGRLFFTPQERERLEMQGEVKSNGPVQRDTLIVNGMIQKSGGKRTIWINGKPQTVVASPGKAPASVQIAVPGSATPIEVKVGQRIELNSAQTVPQE